MVHRIYMSVRYNKGKEVDLYSAYRQYNSTTKRSDVDHTELPAKRKLGEHKITAPRWQTCWSLGLGSGLKLARHDLEVDVALTSSSCLANPNLTLTHLLRLILVVDLVALH